MFLHCFSEEKRLFVLLLILLFLALSGDFLLDFVQLCRKKESTNELLSHSILNPSSDTGQFLCHSILNPSSDTGQFLCHSILNPSSDTGQFLCHSILNPSSDTGQFLCHSTFCCFFDAQSFEHYILYFTFNLVTSVISYL